MTTHLSDAELVKLETHSDLKVAALAAEVRRLRQLITQTYGYIADVPGTEELKASFPASADQILPTQTRRSVFDILHCRTYIRSMKNPHAIGKPHQKAGDARLAVAVLRTSTEDQNPRPGGPASRYRTLGAI